MKQGEILKTYRERMNFSQEDVASYLGIKREMLSYFENDSREPSLAVLEQLANLYGVELTDFFEDNTNQMKVNLSFAFRAENITKEDLVSIASFRKVVKNYYKILQLEKEDGK